MLDIKSAKESPFNGNIPAAPMPADEMVPYTAALLFRLLTPSSADMMFHAPPRRIDFRFSRGREVAQPLEGTDKRQV
jgi:hypothetical protein